MRIMGRQWITHSNEHTNSGSSFSSVIKLTVGRMVLHEQAQGTPQHLSSLPCGNGFLVSLNQILDYMPLASPSQRFWGFFLETIFLSISSLPAAYNSRIQGIFLMQFTDKVSSDFTQVLLLICLMTTGKPISKMLFTALFLYFFGKIVNNTGIR